MQELYKIGFIICLVMLITVATISSLIISNNHNSNVLTSALSAYGSIFGGTAGLIVAVAAISGLDTWKKQIRHGKYLTLIWEAKVHLRRIESSLSKAKVYLIFTVTKDSTEKSIEEFRVAERQLKKEIQNASDTCKAIDKLITRNGWLNSNDLGFIEGAWLKYKTDYQESYIELTENPTEESINTYIAHFEINNINAIKIESWIRKIDDRLDQMEEEYS